MKIISNEISFLPNCIKLLNTTSEIENFGKFIYIGIQNIVYKFWFSTCANNILVLAIVCADPMWPFLYSP